MIFSWLKTCSANQLTGFYMMGTLVVKRLNILQLPTKFIAPHIRLITINRMSPKIVKNDCSSKLSKDSPRQEV